MSRPYRTIFTATLVQDSALNVGGTVDALGIDAPLARDGAGRFTIRGTALAGALVATARRLGYTTEQLSPIADDPELQTSHDGGQQDRARALKPSRWRVYNSHPKGNPIPEVRPGVGIRQDTGAAADGVLYTVEVLPRGTRWPIILEVEHRPDDGLDAAAIAAAVLREWSWHRGFIGSGIARGLGWVHVEDLQAFRLDDAHIDLWPIRVGPNERPGVAIPRRLHELAEQYALELGENQREHLIARHPAQGAPWHFIEIEGVIEAGRDPDGYGLDSISLLGLSSDLQPLEWDATLRAHHCTPPSLDPAYLATWYDPGGSPLQMSRIGDRLEPVIPGSSIRGALRHTFSRLRRLAGEVIADPNTAEGRKSLSPPDGQAPAIWTRHATDQAARIFGALHFDGPLIVRDAHLVDGSEWLTAVMQHHAEDEFTAGPFASSKFERPAILEGRFALRMLLEAPTFDEVVEMRTALDSTLLRARHGHVSLGGAWRGHGWPVWRVLSDRESTYGAPPGDPS